MEELYQLVEQTFVKSSNLNGLLSIDPTKPTQIEKITKQILDDTVERVNANVCSNQ